MPALDDGLCCVLSSMYKVNGRKAIGIFYILYWGGRSIQSCRDNLISVRIDSIQSLSYSNNFTDSLSKMVRHIRNAHITNISF